MSHALKSPMFSPVSLDDYNISDTLCHIGPTLFGKSFVFNELQVTYYVSRGRVGILYTRMPLCIGSILGMKIARIVTTQLIKNIIFLKIESHKNGPII